MCAARQDFLYLIYRILLPLPAAVAAAVVVAVAAAAMVAVVQPSVAVQPVVAV